MSRLAYRTPFDVPGGTEVDIRKARPDTSDAGRGWMLVTPNEIRRLEQTYQPFPVAPAQWLSASWWSKQQTKLLPPAPENGK